MWKSEQQLKSRTPIRLFPLTNKNGHQKPGQPLFLHLLDHGLLSGRRGFAHDGEGVDVSDGAHGGRREPRQAEQRTDGAQDDDEQEIQVEARTFDQPTLLLTDDQSDGSEEKQELIQQAEIW